jgi:hypothetical protein
MTINQNQSMKVLINSHFTGEAWGLDLNPNENLAVTSGDDNKLIAFDTVKN